MSKSDADELSRVGYWDERYQNAFNATDAENGTSEFEWFRTFEQIRSFLSKHLPEPRLQPRLPHLDCGNSRLTAELHEIGYIDQLNVDFSAVVIANMSRRYDDLNVDWLQMDVRNMSSLPAESIDVAIDKGTMDAMIYGSPWDPPSEVREGITSTLENVHRLLKPGGTFLYISYRQPHFIKLLLPGIFGNLEVVNLEDSGGGVLEYFGYVMKKPEVQYSPCDYIQ